MLTVVCFSIWHNVFTQNNSLLVVHFYDVGQGDAIFIETPTHHQILIDGGPDSTILEKLGRDLSFFDRSLDLVILTHPDSDHLNGLIDVLQSYHIDKIIYTGIKDDLAAYKFWQELIKKKHIPVIFAQANERIKISQNLWIDILYPFENLVGQSFKKTNNTSVVCRLVFGKDSFLLTGDIDISVEKQLIKFYNLKSNVLKVSHHGSKYSTSQTFLKAVLPQMAVISVGRKNRYGHPHRETLKRLEGIHLFRTDINGDIEILTDGYHLAVKTLY